MADDLCPVAEAFLYYWGAPWTGRQGEEFRAELAALLETVRAEGRVWIPVTERLPPAGQRVLVFTRYGRVEMAWCEPEGWVDEDVELMGTVVQAWKALPPGPASEEGDEE